MSEEMMDYLIDRIAALDARHREYADHGNYTLAAVQSILIDELQGLLDKFTTVR